MIADLQTTLNELIKHHEMWSSKDFTYSQWILWIALLGSATATVCASVQKLPKCVIAFFAVLPALALSADKTFRYRERAMWHEVYTIELSNLKDDLENYPAQKPKVAEGLKKLRKDMHDKWPTENISEIPNPPKDAAEPATSTPAPSTPKGEEKEAAQVK
jgi:hypothetical protein